MEFVSEEQRQSKLIHDSGEETKEIGIKGTPMWLRFNMRYILSDRSSCSGNYLIANHFEKNMRYSHQLDDHWNVSMHYHQDMRKKALNLPTNEFGWSLGYTC